MYRFLWVMLLVFFANILLAGCTAPEHLVNKSEPTQDEKMQQTIAAWKETHISKAIQKWGSPDEVSDDGTGWQTYIWEIPVQGFIAKQEDRVQGFQLRRRSGVRAVGGNIIISTDYTYQFTFYTRPNGTIYKTDIKKELRPCK